MMPNDNINNYNLLKHCYSLFLFFFLLLLAQNGCYQYLQSYHLIL